MVRVPAPGLLRFFFEQSIELFLSEVKLFSDPSAMSLCNNWHQVARYDIYHTRGYLLVLLVRKSEKIIRSEYTLFSL